MSRRAQRLVIGMGESGLSMAAYWYNDYLITAVDDRCDPPKKEQFQKRLPAVKIKCGENFRRWQQEDFAAYELIAVSPGIAPADVHAAAQQLTNDAACFSEAWQREAPASSRLLAITGTNGKSTAVALAAHLINSCGSAAQAVGNIGKPMLTALLQWRRLGFPAVVVVELSSFQLELASAFYSDAALVLNVGDDHLDRHGDIEHYAAIKRRIYDCSQRAVVNAAAALYPDLTPAVSYAAGEADADWTIDDGWIHHHGQRYAPTAAMSDACKKYPELTLAALALTEALSLPATGVQAGLASFAGLLHRRQFIANHNGVIYIDDSKATNVEAALFALTHSPGKVVWIGGGDGKGQDFSALAGAAAHLRTAVLIGKDGAAIAAVLAAAGVPCQQVADMDSAVRHARACARQGDIVLLSPACSSLDMYANYRARGLAFVHAVQEQNRAD